MTISLVNVSGNGLFQWLAAVASYIRGLNSMLNPLPPNPVSCWSSGGAPIHDFGTLFTNITNATPQANYPFIEGVYSAELSQKQQINSTITSLQTLAQNYLINVANQDTPLAQADLPHAMALLISQMQANGQTVRSNTVSASVAAGGSNVGNAQVLCSTVNGNGLNLEYIFPETLTVTATNDQNSGAAAGGESLSIVGQASAGSALLWNWPLGSGANATTTVINPILSNSGGNLLTNSGFDSFTNNVPASWAIQTGTASGTVFGSTSIAHSSYSAASLQITGNGSELTTLTQQFNSSSGTLGTVAEQQAIPVLGWIRASSTPGAGVLVIDLCDGGNNAITDTQGNANSITVNLTSLTTAWVSFSGWFRLPLNMPSTVKLRIRLSTALSNGVSIYIDDLAAGSSPTQVYAPGGPFMAAFRSTVDLVRNDAWNVTVANTMQNLYGAQQVGKFQSLFEVLFGMRATLQMQLPSSTTPTISDGLLV